MGENDLSFERLIHPVAVKTFVDEYWEKVPLLVERNTADFYSNLFRIEDVDSLVGFRQLKYSQLKIAKTEKGTAASKVFYVDRDSTSDINKLYSSYSQGNTVAFNFVQCYWEPAATLCSELEHFFHFPVGINAYFTPRNSQGFAPHFDAHDVFIAQVEGAKTWRIYDSREQLPCGAEDSRTVPPESLKDPQHEVCLQSGDLLYIPRGYVHEACTADSSSVHFTIGVRAYKWSDLIAELLSLASRDNVDMRKALPIGFLNDPNRVTVMWDRVPELVAMLADSAAIERGVDRLRERLIERMRPLPDGHFHCLDNADAMNLETKVAKRKGMMCRVSKNGDSVSIAFPGNRLEGPLQIESALRCIADSEGPFAVRALPDILGDSSKLVLARRAVQEGLLTIVDLASA